MTEIRYPYQEIEDTYFKSANIPLWGVILLGYCTACGHTNGEDWLEYTVSEYAMKKWRGVIYVPFYYEQTYLQVRWQPCEN